MKKTLSWPTGFQPSALLWGTLRALVFLLCIHLAWGCYLWTVFDHVNHSLSEAFHVPTTYNLWPIQKQVFMDAILVFWPAAFAHRLHWLGLAILAGCVLGNLFFFGFNSQP